MASDKSTNIVTSLDRILRERLEQFNIPTDIRNNVRDEILAFFQKPQNKPHGAVVMTPEASMAADLARKNRKTQSFSDPKPERF